MALNLLDSLSTAAATPEKSTFSLKTKDGTDGAAPDFGLMLSGLMGTGSSKGLTAEAGSEDTLSDKIGMSGQELATESTENRITDGAAALLAMVQTPAAPATPAPPTLTALVLSPNMTAITPSQQPPDSRSLEAFAKSQGLDEDIAAWLLSAGQKAPGAAHSSEQTAPLTQPIPMSPPAVWWTARLQTPVKTAGTSAAAPTAPGADTGKTAMHNSDLDLSLIFGTGQGGAKAASTADASFTPAAWAMAGMSNTSAQASSALAASPMVRWLSDDNETNDGLGRVDSTSGNNSLSNIGNSATKPNEPTLATSNAKGTESTLSTADRSEAHQLQAEKMGQAIGQRMLSEIEKGHWHIKMMLKPANLGDVEVQMRLRNGELDASFTASQSATRDLLQDGLPKLKDTLTQMGMDVASMNIGGGSSQRNGGDPTPQQSRALNAQTAPEHSEEQAVIQNTRVTPSGPDGLDVLV